MSTSGVDLGELFLPTIILRLNRDQKQDRYYRQCPSLIILTFDAYFAVIVVIGRPTAIILGNYCRSLGS